MQQFTSIDAQFVAAEDGCIHGHAIALAVYAPTGANGILTTADVRELIGSRIHLLPLFRRRMVQVPLGLDYPYWVEDPNLVLDNHIREHHLAAPGDDQTLAALVSRLMGEPLELRRPPWRVDVIHGLRDGRVAVAIAIHHAAADGIGFAELFGVLHDPTPAPRDLSKGARPHVPVRIPGALEMLARGVRGLPRQVVRLVRSLPRVLPHLDQVAALRAVPGVAALAWFARRAGRPSLHGSDDGFLDGPTVLAPRTATTGRISGQRTTAFGSTSMAEIKAIKDEFGVTVNDVVMSIVAGGLRAWLSDHGDLPARPLAALVPVSVRDRYQGPPSRNNIAMMIPPVFSEEPNPARRLERTRDAMRAAKLRQRTVPATVLQDANHLIPPFLLARTTRVLAKIAARTRRGAAANLVISNVPGARDRQYLAGVRLEAMFPFSLIFHGLGLNVTVVSYCDQVDWGVNLDPAQIDDAWGLIHHVRGAQASLLACVTSVGVVPGEEAGAIVGADAGGPGLSGQPPGRNF